MNLYDEIAPPHPHHHKAYWKRAHRDWKFWGAALLLIALILVFAMSDGFSMRPRRGGGSLLNPVPVTNNVVR